VSWLTWHDVADGRSRMNFSDWTGTMDAQALQYAVNNNMPPKQYTLIHPNAKLTDQEKQTLLNGFSTSLADNSGSSSGSTASPTPAPTSTSGGNAVAIINQRCGSCHSADPAVQFHASSSQEAQALIDSMKQRGAQLSASEEQALIAYYTR
jgi:hypothetical protein